MVGKKVDHEQKIRDNWNDVETLKKIREALRKYKAKCPTVFESEKKEAWVLITSRLNELGTRTHATIKNESSEDVNEVKPSFLEALEERI